MERLLADLRTEARWIIVESPSVTSGPDVYTLAQAADAAILVVEVRRTTSDQVLESIEHLDRMGANVLGAAVVPSLNAATQRSVRANEPGPVEPVSQSRRPSSQNGRQRDWAEQRRRARRPERRQSAG